MCVLNKVGTLPINFQANQMSHLVIENQLTFNGQQSSKVRLRKIVDQLSKYIQLENWASKFVFRKGNKSLTFKKCFDRWKLPSVTANTRSPFLTP